MGWDFGRPSGMGRQSLTKGWPLRRVMIEECGFGRIGGVEMIPYRRLALDCTL